jgi:hypothetical protein
MLSTLLSGAAHAQRPPLSRDSVPKDSVQRDTLRADTVLSRPVDNPIMLILLPATVLLMVAPAPLAMWGESGPTEMTFLHEHRAVRVSAGGQFHERQGVANSVEFEVVRKQTLAQLQAEDYWRPRHVRYLTARVGYLWHPKRVTAGAVTVGYVHADGDPAQSGPELGFPLFLGNSTITLRFEPTYVVSQHGPLWSERMQLESDLPWRSYFVGASLVGKSQPLWLRSQDHLFASAVTVLVGSRF